MSELDARCKIHKDIALRFIIQKNINKNQRYCTIEIIYRSKATDMMVVPRRVGEIS